MLIPYIRRSRADEETLSVGQQLGDIKEWAKRTGTELANPVVEKGVSGHKSWRERELGEVIARCERGEADGVVVAYFSRLTREKMSATWEVLETLVPHRLVAIREGIDSAPGDEPDWNAAIQGFQANSEWRTLTKHLRAGKHATWEAGAYLSKSFTPAGYDVEQYVSPTKGLTGAALLRKNDHGETIGRAIALRAQGASWAEVARALEGVPGLTGRTSWTIQAAQGVVKNPIYKGLHRCPCGCGKERLRPELALVTAETWARAQPRPSDEKQKAGRRDPGTYLLSGFLICATCGQRLIHRNSVTRGKEYHRYRCRNDLCGARAQASALQLEPFMLGEALKTFLANSTLRVGREPNVERLVALEHDRDEARARLKALIQMLDPLEPGAEDRLNEARAALRAAEDALIAEQESRVEGVSEADVRALVESASVEDRRRLLRLTMYGATVKPGKAPVADRVEIAYKG